MPKTVMSKTTTPKTTPAAMRRLSAAGLAGLLCLGAAACGQARTVAEAGAPDAEPAQTEPLPPEQAPPDAPTLATSSGVVIESRAWIDAMPGVGVERTLVVEITLETPCANDKARLEGVGGFGVTGRTYLVEATVERSEICLTALGRHELRFETELAPNAVYHEAAIRLDGEIAPIPLQIAQ